MGWAASPTRKGDSLFSVPLIQMGARVYLASAGRFLQTDPVEGGTANDYAYVNDPVNDADYSGMFSLNLKKIFTLKNVARVAIAAVAVYAAVQVVAAVAVCIATVVCGATTAAMIAGAAAASVAFGAVAVTGKINNPTTNVAGTVAVAGLSVTPAPATPKITPAVSSSYRSSLSIGQTAHNEFSQIVRSQGGIANQSVFQGSRLRPDGYFPQTNIVQELKPANPQGVVRGQQQLQGYVDLSGGQGQLWLYNQNKDGSFNFWQHQ